MYRNPSACTNVIYPFASLTRPLCLYNSSSLPVLLTHLSVFIHCITHPFCLYISPICLYTCISLFACITHPSVRIPVTHPFYLCNLYIFLHHTPFLLDTCLSQTHFVVLHMNLPVYPTICPCHFPTTCIFVLNIFQHTFLSDFLLSFLP